MGYAHGEVMLKAALMLHRSDHVRTAGSRSEGLTHRTGSPLGIEGGVVICLLALGCSARSQTPAASVVPAEAQPAEASRATAPGLVSLSPTQPSFRLGEPQWIVVTFEGLAPEPVSRGPIARHPGLEVRALDPEGPRVSDPLHRPLQQRSVGKSPDPPWVQTLDLAAYTWLTPGTWQLEVRWILPMWPDPETPWRTIDIEILPVSPDEAPGVIATLPPTFAEQPEGRLHSYDALGHPVFVPHLEALIAGADPEIDERALYGLEACPCVEATEALIRLHDTVDGNALKQQIREVLGWRIPRERAVGSDRGRWFAQQAWHAELGASARRLAHEVLADAAGTGWEHEVAWGASILARIGEAADGPAVGAAVALALEAPLEGNGDYRRWRTVQALQPALHRTAPTVEGLEPDVVALVGLLGWDGRTGAPPPGYEEHVLAALASPHPTVRAIATERLPPEASGALIAAVVPLVGTGLPSERFLHRWLDHHPEPEIRDALLAELEGAEPAEPHVIPPERVSQGDSPTGSRDCSGS